ncbi:hypothetical protein [uncultured Draconibacterium sp.]|uniref:hypothetical protein n=1 Tax=uncultured Draconibacterium sp. TaxID=1573823 RepID=UPI0032167149
MEKENCRVHLRLDNIYKAQWLEIVEFMGEKKQSVAFKRLVKDIYEKMKKNNERERNRQQREHK